jgi:uncharacterized protein (DUF1330 family)|tara:strand:+ start:286 stop:576 length:291 start_codon:yes stop_codon:yes gene_type:complete
MPKGYFVVAHRSKVNVESRDEYLKIASPAILAVGGKILASNDKIFAYENGLIERVVLIEFVSFEVAKKFYNSQEYQKALAVLKDGADRDFRIIEGI